VVDSLFYNADALFRGVFSQSEKLQITAVPVIGQSCHPQDPLHHFQAVVGALLRIYIKHFPLFLGQFSRIS
jgi:hypothetical protein